MANLRISALPAASTPLAGTELVPVVQGGITEQVTVANLTAGRAVSVGSLSSSGAISGTTGNFSGRISTTVGNNDFALRSTGATTGFNVVSINNTGGQAIFGQENSTGNNLIVGDSGYDTIIRGESGLAFSANAGSNLHMRISSAGNVTVNTGNLVIGTSGKGINFTANTPLAGMTSQLLNWYEEGTWTPTISATSGAITTSSSSSAFYTRVGSVVSFTVVLTITNNGTGAGQLRFTIPFNGSRGYANAVGTNASSGATVQGTSSSSSPSSIDMNKVDGTYPVSSGQSLRISGTYII